MTAIEHRRDHLHYQPQVDLRNGALLAVEALARSMPPTRGMIPPPSSSGSQNEPA